MNRLASPTVEQVRWLLTGASFVSACTVAALHAPGHVSMDTSIQLHEAQAGRSVSWNPPFMSALLRWLGGGELATTSIVLLQVLLLYGGTLLAAHVLLRSRALAGEGTVPVPAVLLALAIVLNPVVALYAGIVWKDVLFAAFLTGAVALGYAALFCTSVARLICTAGAVVVLAAALLTRQQGVFMAPVLLPMLFAAENWRRWSWRCIAIAAAFVGAVLVLQYRVGHTVRDSGTRSTSVGFRSIMVFDMMGILARAPQSAAELAVPITPAQLEAVRRVYQPSRIDYITNDPLAEAWADGLDASALLRYWWALVRHHPVPWLDHRAMAYATLLGLRGVQATQPVFMGVEGNPAFLKDVGLQERRGPRDVLIWQLASSMLGWPLWRHAFWLLVLGGCTFAWWRRSLSPGLRRATGCIIAACTLFYASFMPTVIASDFRYLFGAIPLIGMLLFALTLAPTSIQGDR